MKRGKRKKRKYEEKRRYTQDKREIEVTRIKKCKRGENKAGKVA
jgi:hypothetical protein